MSGDPRRVLVVCLGNHCRSPMAAAALERHGPPGTEIRSAGLADKHAGRPAHPKMIVAASSRGYDLTGHRGAQISESLLEWADIILAMDTAVLDKLRNAPGLQPGTELRLYFSGQDVPDPWGQSDDAFHTCAAMIDDGAVEALR